MYQNARFRAGTARYQSVDISSRIEGATPYRLVQIMYEELLKALDAMAFAAARGDYVKRGERQSKVLAIPPTVSVRRVIRPPASRATTCSA